MIFQSKLLRAAEDPFTFRVTWPFQTLRLPSATLSARTCSPEAISKSIQEMFDLPLRLRALRLEVRPSSDGDQVFNVLDTGTKGIVGRVFPIEGEALMDMDEEDLLERHRQRTQKGE